MRIAIINKFLFEHGGQEAVMLEEARLLAEAGHTVALWGMQHPRNAASLPHQHTFAPYVDFSSLSGRFSTRLARAVQFVRNPAAGRQFQRFLAEFQPDVIHAHGIAHQLTPTMLTVANRAGVPVVQTLHDYQLICPSYTLLRGNGRVCESVDCQTAGQGFAPCVRHRCIKHSTAASVLNAVEMTVNAKPFRQGIRQFIAPSRFMQQLMQRHGIGPVCHVPNCVAFPPDQLADADELSPLACPPRFIVYAGRLSHEKGLSTLMAACRLVPDLPLVVIGEGPLKAALQAEAPPHVQWLGFQPRQRVTPWLKRADAMVLPSEWFENAPMSVIEANLVGTPVIASAIGGLPEMVEPGQTGWLFPSGNVDALAECLRQALDNPEQAASLGRQALAQVRVRHDPADHLNALLTLYQSVQ